MSMTREEAIKIISDMILDMEYSNGTYKQEYTEEESKRHLALYAAKDALRGPTREMVERMRGEWIPDGSDFDDDDTLLDVDDWCDWQCSACHSEICYDDPMERRWLPKFCPNCGAPMTDEAVAMMLEKWKEALSHVGD